MASPQPSRPGALATHDVDFAAAAPVGHPTAVRGVICGQKSSGNARDPLIQFGTASIVVAGIRPSNRERRRAIGPARADA